MASEVDYQEILEEAEAEIDGSLIDDFPRTRGGPGRDRDYRRAIEELREERRLRRLLSDYDLEDVE